LKRADHTTVTKDAEPSALRRGAHPLARLALVLLRLVLHLLSFVVTLSLAAVSIGLGGVAALLWIVGRDVTIGPETLPVWPESLVTIDLLHAYAWAYLAGGLGVLLIGLPLALAVAEKTVLGARLRAPGGRILPSPYPRSHE